MSAKHQLERVANALKTSQKARLGAIFAVVMLLGGMYVLGGDETKKERHRVNDEPVKFTLTGDKTGQFASDAILADMRSTRKELASLADDSRKQRDADAEQIRQLRESGKALERESAQLRNLLTRLESRLGKTEERLEQLPGTLARSGSASNTEPSDAGAGPLDPTQADLANLFGADPTPTPAAGAPGTPVSGNAQGADQGGPKIVVVGQDEKEGKLRRNEKAETTQRQRLSREQEAIRAAFLPTGAILSGIMLNGLDANASPTASSQPQPILFRVKRPAHLPNRYAMDIRECFIVAAGYGDMASERAYIRAETLSCVKTDGKAIDISVDAYAVGEDGKVGVRGRLVEKNGQLIAKSMLAGLLSGFGQAMTPSQIPTINTQATDGSPLIQYPDLGQVATIGGMQGASTSLGMISEYYLSVAQNIFPIIEVDAGRKIDFIVKKGVPLRAAKGVIN